MLKKYIKKRKRSLNYKRPLERLVIPPPVLDRGTIEEFCKRAKQRIAESRAYAVRNRDEHAWFAINQIPIESQYPRDISENKEVRAAKLWNERVIALDDAISSMTKTAIELMAAV